MTGDPLFLELEEVLLIHLDQIRRFGGAPEIRDLGLLESAVEMPRAGVRGQYFHADVFEMAAAYLFHISRNHPFADGNKRTGAAAALVFLDLNGIKVRCPHSALVQMVRKVAEGKADKPAAAAFFRRHARK